jgi:hypothetical protein
MKEILKVIVGSRSHGLNDAGSDTDCKGVFVHSTEFMLTISPDRVGATNTHNTKNDADDVMFELNKFCMAAAKCNPTMLEILKSPIQRSTVEGTELVRLFPQFLNKQYIYDAFRGYSHQQRLELRRGTLTNPRRRSKHKTAALRILYNGIELLNTGSFTLRIVDTSIGEICKQAKSGNLEDEAFFTHCDDLESRLGDAYNNSKLPTTANYSEINKFLLRVRKENWTHNETAV